MSKTNLPEGFTPVENEQKDTNIVVVDKRDMATVELMDGLKNPTSAFYCSIKDDGSRRSKVAIYNALQNAEEQLSDHMNEVLEVVNVIAHPVTLSDMNTGEITQCLRTVLITKDGKGYQAVSEGIASSLQKIFAIVGTPEGDAQTGSPAWTEEPVKMKIVSVKTSNGFKVNKLVLVD